MFDRGIERSGKGGEFYKVLIDGNLGVFLKLHSSWRETLHALERERDRYSIHTYIHTHTYMYVCTYIKHKIVQKKGFLR